MTNLDRILDRIRADGEERALTVDRETDEEILRLKTQADEECAGEVAAVAEAARRDGAKTVTLAKSAALALRKKKALQAKSQALDEAVEAALRRLAELPEEDYVDLILTLIEKNTDGTPGEVLLAQGRPAADKKTFAARLAALPGKALTLSEETAPLATGVLVSYGKIRVDLSFDAVIADKRDAIRDRLADMIFRDAAKG